MRPKATANAAANGHTHESVPRVAENGYRLPDPLPPGVLLTDSTKREWLLGKSIGRGGFGEIYCAKDLPELTAGGAQRDPNGYNGQPRRSCVKDLAIKRMRDLRDKSLKSGRQLDDNSYPFVVKVDHICGPLYAEMHFYHRAAKPKQIDAWMLSQRLAFLGMPRYVASGIHVETNGRLGKRQKYRFLVLDRLGLDLQKVLTKQNNRLELKSAYTITMRVIDILAYIHSFGYIHADIKASNLLLGRLDTCSPARELYLVDYGLVERYRTQNGEHKEQEEDQRRANNGTIEFTSRDGHLGALSRRSDLETLVYNLISWLSGGRLPWIERKDHEAVRKMKTFYMSHIDELLKYAFKAKPAVPRGLDEFVRSISRLGFKEDPDYAQLKLILTRAIVGSGFANDGLICWGVSPKKTVFKGAKRPASSSPDLGRGKLRKVEKLEFEQLDHCDIPRKTGRTRGVRSAPTTLTRNRTNSMSAANADIELTNPTPQMLEVMELIKLKSDPTRLDPNASEFHINQSAFNMDSRRRTASLSNRRGKRRKSLKGKRNKPTNRQSVKQTYETELHNHNNNTYYYYNCNKQTANDFKIDNKNIIVANAKRKRNATKLNKTSKKYSILRRTASTRERIPLQKININEKTTTAATKSPDRAIEASVQSKHLKAVLKRKPPLKKRIVVSLITRSKSKVSKLMQKKRQLKSGKL